jgi:D-tyrosyl-tRNA(Tyr) deacylase
MRVVIQRVTRASVTIAGELKSSIGRGMMILVGFCNEDTDQDLDWAVKKIAQLRIYDDEQGVMNKSIEETGGEILAVSQFTLYASCKKGNRPSYIRAAKPDISVPLYDAFCEKLQERLQKPIQTGVFGADMQVELINDGPVTICIDTKNID